MTNIIKFYFCWKKLIILLKKLSRDIIIYVQYKTEPLRNNVNLL